MSDKESVRKQVAGRLGVSQDGESVSFSGGSLLASMGGKLGITEAILPSILFIASYAVLQNGLVSVSLAAGSSLLFLIYRAVTRGVLTQAIVGAVSVGLAAFLALREGGNTEDYFLVGFYTNGAYFSVLLISILIRYPLIGLAVALLANISNWRQKSPLRMKFYLVTWVWVGFFGLRLLVQLPLYFAGNIEGLATARLVMGAPAYAILLAFSWVALRSVFKQKTID